MLFDAKEKHWWKWPHSFILWDCLTTLELKYSQRYLENTVIWEANWHYNDEIRWRKSVSFFKYYKASEWNQSPRQVEGSNTDKRERMRNITMRPIALTEGGRHAQHCWGLWGYEKVLEEAGQLCAWEAGMARTLAWGGGRTRLLAFVIWKNPLWRLQLPQQFKTYRTQLSAPEQTKITHGHLKRIST